MGTLTLKTNGKDLEERITLQDGELIIQKNIVKHHKPTEAKLDNKKLKELKETARDLAYCIDFPEKDSPKKLRAYYDTGMPGAPFFYIEPYYKGVTIQITPFVVNHKIALILIDHKGVNADYKNRGLDEDIIRIEFEARYELAEELQSAKVG